MSTAPLLSTQSRYESLDVFRGITLASMLIANNPGDWKHIYAPWKHANWDGCTFTDLIFPAFVFIMGISMPLSLGKRMARGDSSGQLTWSAIRRGLILIALGLVLGSFSYFLLRDPESPRALRIPGVLQRLGVVSMAASLLLIVGLKFRGILMAIIGLLGGYQLLMLYIPVPGFGAGVLERPGNLATYLDDKIFGNHAHQYLKEHDIWHDPEGFLSTFTAVSSALIGCLCGFVIRDSKSDLPSKINKFMVSGLALVIAGWLWDAQFPINKHLWSPSFVLFTAGWSIMGLGACMWMIEVKKWRRWSLPFLALGSNPILIYCLVGVVTILSVYVKLQSGTEKLALKTWLYRTLFGWMNRFASPEMVSLMWGLTYIALFSIFAWMLYRKKIFIRV